MRDGWPGWTPPEDMLPDVARTWSQFYRRAWDAYEVSPRLYRALYLAQSGRCYICQKAKGIHPDDPKGRGGRRLGVDHDHNIGNKVTAVRALLCTGSTSANTCNRLIARYSVGALSRAADVLIDRPAQQLLAAGDNMTDAELKGWLTNDN